MKSTQASLALVALLAGALGLRAEAPAAKVSVTVAPQRVWIVPGNGANKINFDFMASNQGEAPVEIVELRLAVFDSKGAFVTGRELNQLGMVPSIQSLLVTEIAPGKSAMLFNPFCEFPADVELAVLKYTLVFLPSAKPEEEGKAGAQPTEVELTVRPEPLKVRTALSLPLKGKVYIWDGHEFYAHHRRVDMTHPLILQLGIKNNISRYGLDFMEVDAQGRRFQGAGDKREDYFIFGRTIYAPAAGIVEDCVDGRPDSPIGEMLVDYEEIMRTKDLRLFGGNFVVLDHGDGERSYFAHMKQGSVRVKKGDRIKAGAPIGQVGSSGDSAEPHLHYHLLSGQGLDCELIPPLFRDYTLHLGSRSVKVRAGVPDSGDLVESK